MKRKMPPVDELVVLAFDLAAQNRLERAMTELIKSLPRKELERRALFWFMRWQEDQRTEDPAR